MSFRICFWQMFRKQRQGEVAVWERLAMCRAGAHRAGYGGFTWLWEASAKLLKRFFVQCLAPTGVGTPNSIAVITASSVDTAVVKGLGT